MRGFPSRDTEGRIVLWYLLHTDIDDRKRVDALLVGEKRLLEMVAGGQSMSGILEALCHFVESTASGCYCSVVLGDPSGPDLEHGAAPSLPANNGGDEGGRKARCGSVFEMRAAPIDQHDAAGTPARRAFDKVKER